MNNKITKEMLDDLPNCRDCKTLIHPRNFKVSQMFCGKCYTSRKIEGTLPKRVFKQKEVSNYNSYESVDSCTRCGTTKNTAILVFFHDERVLCLDCRRKLKLTNK